MLHQSKSRLGVGSYNIAQNAIVFEDTHLQFLPFRRGRMISIGEAVDCDWPTELALGISMRLRRRGLTS